MDDPKLDTDAPPQNGEVQAIETAYAAATEESGDSQESSVADIEMTMADVAIADGPGADKSIKAEVKEVKLEDLFADDMESDEEFPSSRAPDIKASSSPVEAPASPV